MRTSTIQGVAKYVFRPALWLWVQWSFVYRWLYHRKYKKLAPMPLGLPLAEVEALLDKLTWKPDSFREMWDSCGSPHRVQYVLNEINAGRPQPEGALDCDDHSVWAANVLAGSFSPKLLTVVWITKEGTVAGHCVCLCSTPGGLFYIGNWPKSQLLSNLHDVTKDIILRARATEIIGWSVLSKEMKVQAWGRGMPGKKDA